MIREITVGNLLHLYFSVTKRLGKTKGGLSVNERVLRFKMEFNLLELTYGSSMKPIALYTMR